jgi:dTMP kinase
MSSDALISERSAQIRENLSRIGTFLVLAGCDAAGKSEQAQRLDEALRRSGVSSRVTGEPWTSDEGWQIRKMLSRGGTLDPVELSLLFAADRAAHNRALRDWMMRDHTVVISTRYIESSMVYQGLTLEGRGSEQWVTDINSRFLQPSAYLVLDVPVEEAEGRLRRRFGERLDAFEADRAFQARVCEAFLGLEILMPEQRIVHIDGVGTPDEVHERVVHAALAFL